MRTNPDQRSFWSLEPSLVTVLDLLRIDILDYKSQFDIFDCSLWIVVPRFFTLKQVTLKHLVLFIFPLCLTHVLNV